MTNLKVKENRKSFDLTFKVKYQKPDDIIRDCEMTVRVSKYYGNLDNAIVRAKQHIKEKLVHYHSIA
jgi:hypothetical protein